MPQPRRFDPTPHASAAHAFMSLDTVIHAGLTHPSRPSNALVLMGGGARTAYQAGVLRALASMLRLHPEAPQSFPFQVLVGTSAGALNAAYLASCATTGLDAFDQLARFWGRLRSSSVYELNVSPWVRASRVIAAASLARHARAHGALINNMPLVDTLHHAVSLPGIDEALQARTLDALAVTASSYTSGVHWTFCHTASDDTAQTWSRPGRRAEFQPITIEHLMASSAIPFIFPSTALWVDGRREFFGDGSMRQVSPLSPAMHLGASKVLVIGVGQPQRSAFAGAGADAHGNGSAPSIGSIAGHAMASVFHDTLQADVEQAQRISQTLRQLPREVAAVLPYRSVEVLAIQPSQSLDALAQAHAHELPSATHNALSGLGALRGGGAALASYLLFEPGFVQALMALGEQDAFARKAELLAFFTS
jgi:NTE family protein